MNHSKHDSEFIILEIDLKQIPENIKKKINFIKVSEIGKNTEYWLGHLCPKFEDELIFATIKSTGKNLLTRLEPRRIKILPIHSFFDEGQGPQYYVDGIKQPNEDGLLFNNLNDFDINLSYFNVMRKKSKYFQNQDDNLQGETSIIFTNSWNGTTCMRLKGTLVPNLSHPYKFYRLKIKKISNNSFVCMIVHQGNSSNIEIDIILNSNINKLFKMKKNNVCIVNNWYLSKFEITICQANIENLKFLKSLYLVLTNTSKSLQQYDIKIGEISFYNKDWIKALNDFDLINVTQYISYFKMNFNNPKNMYGERKNGVIFVHLELDLLKLPENAENLIKNIRIYKNGKWIMNSKSPSIFIEDLEISKDNKAFDELQIQILLKNGNRAALKEIVPIKLECKKFF